jgi:hypothetical protein
MIQLGSVVERRVSNVAEKAPWPIIDHQTRRVIVTQPVQPKGDGRFFKATKESYPDGDGSNYWIGRECQMWQAIEVGQTITVETTIAQSPDNPKIKALRAEKITWEDGSGTVPQAAPRKQPAPTAQATRAAEYTDAAQKIRMVAAQVAEALTKHLRDPEAPLQTALDDFDEAFTHVEMVIANGTGGRARAVAQVAARALGGTVEEDPSDIPFD